MASDEEPFGALGFAVVSDQASVIGITAVPSPTTDASSSLFFSWTPWFAPIETGTVVGFDAQAGQQYEFDSKAMRKVELGEDLVVTIENQNAADGASVLFLARILIKTN